MNYKKYIVYLLCVMVIFFILPSPGAVQAANSVKFSNLTNKDGLPSDAVFSVIQDHVGFIWFGSYAGLVRYDGLEFITYTFDPYNSQSLSSNSIWVLCEDCAGNIWVGTEGGGLNKFDTETGTFTRYKHDPENSNSLSNDKIRCILEDSCGNIWIGTENGLDVLPPNGSSFTHFYHDNADSSSLSSNGIRDLLEDGDGNIWIATDNGLNLLNRASNGFICFRNDPNDPYSLSSNSIRALYQDNLHRIWVGLADVGGVNIFDPYTYHASSISYRSEGIDMSKYVVFDITEDCNNNIWIGTQNGLYRTNLEGNQFEYFSHNSADPYSITNNIVRVIYEDNAGTIWIGTNGGGVNKFEYTKDRFEIYCHIEGNEGSLSSDMAYSIIQDSIGYIWIGTDNGLNRIDPVTGEIIHYGINACNPTGLPNRIIHAIYEDSYGTLWVGTLGGLARLNVESGEFEVLPEFANNRVLSIAEDSQGQLWVGDFLDGIIKIDISTGLFRTYVNNPQDPNSLSDDSVNSIFVDSSDNVWIGTNNGLNLYNRAADNFTVFTEQQMEGKGLSCDVINNIFEDSQGRLWISTNGGGVNLLNRNGFEFTHYTTQDGFPSSIIFFSVEDMQGHLWLGTNNGLCDYDSSNGHTVNYDIYNGLPSDQFNSASCLLEDGRLMLGTTQGVVAFYPDEMVIGNAISPVILTNFTVDGLSDFINKPVYQIDNLTLPYSNNSFSFEFAVLDYSASIKNQYAYLLEGFEESWHYTDASKRIAMYTNIPAGEYTLHIIGSNGFGVWNNSGVTLKISIVPPIWQSWWFIGLMVISAVGLLYIGYRLRLGILSNQNRRLGKLVEEHTLELRELYEKERSLHNCLEIEVQKRAEFTRALFHELKTPLTPLLPASEYLVNEIKNEPARSFARCVRSGVEKLDHRIEELLDLARGEVGILTLKQEQVRPSSLLGEAVDYFRPLAAKYEQQLISDFSYSLPAVWVDRDRIKQVVLNLLSNAMKFTRRGGIITVVSVVKGEYLEVSVTDTGRGIEKDRLEHIFLPYHQRMPASSRKIDEKLGGLGLGLALCKIIVELHGGEIWVRSHRGKGSTFSFTIPLATNIPKVAR
jgi:Signal transduction histidine kinase